VKPLQRQLGLALIVFLSSCNEPGNDRVTSPPVTPHAIAVLRAAQIRIADRPEIDITVTTAPGQRVLRLQAPASIEGFEIIASQRLPIVREPQQWLHRHRFQLRALEIGHFEWPAQQLTVASDDGARTRIELAPIELEVASIMNEHPNRTAAYAARPAPRPQLEPRTRLRALAAVATSLVFAAAAFLLVKRRRTRKNRPTPDPARDPLPAPWNAALGDFDLAGHLARDPAAASHHASAALHHYMGRRFGARTRMHTSEELAEIDPPYAATSSWPTFVALLRDFDDLRFRPAVGEDERLSADFTATLARARAFIEATTPPPGLQ
jgi:hypothetical protein